MQWTSFLPRSSGGHSHGLPRAAAVVMAMVMGVVVLGLGPNSALAQQSSKPLVVFGDSLSDQGNRARQVSQAPGLTFPTEFYYDGRWSSGPVWADFFDAAMPSATAAGVTKREVANYAYGSAEACAAGATVQGIASEPSLSGQVRNYLSGEAPLNASLSGVSTGPWQTVGGDSTDYMIAIGSNDYIAVLLSVASEGDLLGALRPELENDIVDCIISGVEQLIGGLTSTAGAAAPNHTIVVANLPLLQDTPAISGIRSLVTDPLLQEMVEDHAEVLRRRLDGVSTPPNIVLKYLDMSGVHRLALDRASELGITETEEKCLTTSFPTQYQNYTYTLCGDPSTHFYYDQIHPSSPVHAFFAQQFAPAVQPQGTSEFVDIAAAWAARPSTALVFFMVAAAAIFAAAAARAPAPHTP